PGRVWATGSLGTSRIHPARIDGPHVRVFLGALVEGVHRTGKAEREHASQSTAQVVDAHPHDAALRGGVGAERARGSREHGADGSRPRRAAGYGPDTGRPRRSRWQVPAETGRWYGHRWTHGQGHRASAE